jgi:ubiquinone/menaquinone biosynthesis C-methylase UbiE
MPASVSRDDPEYAGQAVYTPGFLKVYDLLVLRFNGHLAWRCGPGPLVRMYDEHVSVRHLDIGVGSGYFLDKCRFPVQRPEITLMDLNPHSLDAAADRISRYQPKKHLANALEPFGLPTGAFDSVGLNWLLHCIPGDMTAKGAVFDHCKAVLAPGGAVFGSTVLTGGVPQTWFSRWMLDQLNDKNESFSNRDDDLETLESQLDQRFDDTQVDVVGSVAIFSGRA